MKITKKMLIRGGAGAGIFLLLLAGAALLVPRLLDMEAFSRQVAQTLEARYNVRADGVRLAVFPRPHVVMRGIRLNVSGDVTASVRLVTLYPKMFALFTGQFRPAEITLIEPDVAIAVDGGVFSGQAASSGQEAEGGAEKAPLPGVADVRDSMVRLQAAAFAALPGTTIRVDGGKVEVRSARERLFRFEEINARASVLPDRIEVNASAGKSDLWDTFSFDGSVDPNGWKSSGEAKVTGGAPGNLVQRLWPSAEQRLGDSRLDLAVAFSINGPRDFRAEFTSSIPLLSLEGEGEKTVLKNGSLAGTVSLDGERLQVAVSELRFEGPRATLTGEFVENHDGTVSLDIEARNADVAAVRKVSIEVWRKNRVVQRIFEIVRAGEVPFISFRGRGKSASDLKKSENFILRGIMEHGTILAPKAELLVLDVRGNVLVENGVLEGTDLSGRTAGGTTTSNGTLRVGLPDDDHTFHLDLPLDADLSELPPVLDRVVKDDAFKRELALIKNVQGRTQGRLTLGESMQDVKTRVEAGAFQLSGRYERIPDPIEVQGGSFLLEGSKVTAGSIMGGAGKTKFAKLDASYDWKADRLLELRAPEASVLSFDFLNALVKGDEECRKALTCNGSPIKGAVLLDSLDFKGPLTDSSKWLFKAGGAFQDLTIHSLYFSGPVVLKSGAFDISKDTITLKQVDVALADSSLSVSGTLKGYLGDMRGADLRLSGRLGPEGNRDIAALADFPKELRAISDLVLGPSQLVIEKEKTAFKGELRIASGPTVKGGYLRTSEEISFDDVTIKDADSDATLSLDFKERQFKIRFSGSLSNRTADRLLVENKLLAGPIAGKFRAHLYLDSPRKSTAEGEIHIAGFQVPANLRVPARIEHAKLAASGNRIDVKSAMVSWNGSRLSLEGAVTISDDAYRVEMNAFADSLELESVLKAQKEEGARGETEGATGASLPKKGWKAPLKGTIRVRSERLTYGKFTWNPVNADVVFGLDTVEVKVNQANLCGISLPGRMTLTPEGTKMDFSPEAKERDLEPALACLFNKQRLMTGKFDLKGNLSASSEKEGGLAGTLDGNLDFTAKDGRIYRFESFAKIFSLLNITEIYRGQLPDLFNEGCAFDEIRAKGKIEDGKLLLSDSLLDGPCAKLVFRGEIDLAQKKMDVVALITPLRTVDRIVGMVPVLGKLLDGTFMSVPVRIVGDTSDPTVIPLSATAVGEELFGFMKRTFQLPLTIFQPIAEGKN